MGPFLRQLWTMSGVLLNMLGQGMTLSYPSSLMPALRADDAEIKTDLLTASWIASSIGVAGIPGFFLSSFLMDRLGRRMAQILVIIPGILGWIIIYFATTTTALLIGRILGGMTAGASVGLGAVIIGEYTSPSHRGMFLNLKTAVVCVGGMFTHIFGHFYNWRTVALVSLVPCVLGIIRYTNINATTEQPAKNQNTWPVPIAKLSELKLLVTAKLNNQLNVPPVDETNALISIVQSSPAIIQGIGPKPNENDTIKSDNDNSGIHDIACSFSSLVPCSFK
ncbi:major facilitator superfamily domain-containing protein [Phthorimaea operculella]|nr:major facilitator superfamily domain-containing protein [Phthorimaea operculella]